MTIDGKPKVVLRIYKDDKLIDRVEDPNYIPSPGTNYRHDGEKLFVTEVTGNAGNKFVTAEVDCYTISP